MRKVLVALIVLSSFGVSSSAFAAIHQKNPHATYALGKAKSCRVEFVKKTERHMVNGKTKRYIACIYKPKVAVKTGAPVTTSSTVTVTPTNGSTPVTATLGVKLDPTFVQDPNNAHSVTWTFSANETTNTGGKTQLQATVPAGVLDFYVDGLLKCSDNVGDVVTGGDCNVNPVSFGDHTTIVEYSSNAAIAASSSEVDAISPFTPVISAPRVDCTQDSYIGGVLRPSCTIEQPVTISGLASGLAPNGTFTLSGQGAVNPGCSAPGGGSYGYFANSNSETYLCIAGINESCSGAFTWNGSIAFVNDAYYPSASINLQAIVIPADTSGDCPH